MLDGFGKSLEVILPKLRDGYIVPDPAFARDLALENPDAFFLSQTGECFHNVTVTGGKQRAEGPLSMKRELRDVLRMLDELEQALRAGRNARLQLWATRSKTTSLLERLEAEKREAEKQAMTSGHALQQLDHEMARVRERLQHLRKRIAATGRGAREHRKTLFASGRRSIAAAEEQRALELEQLSVRAGAAGKDCAQRAI